ncbi:MAG: MmcQ/YjbR family DNA-binding protein [Terriglobales bacterium]
MTIKDFRRIALSFEGAEESSHMGNPDFRVGGHIFATLASAKQGYGNLKLTIEQQAAFVEELPDVFLPIHGGWGRMGMTHIRLSTASEDVLTGALYAAWKLRVERNMKSESKRGAANELLPGARSGRKVASERAPKSRPGARRKKR